jgi:transposase
MSKSVDFRKRAIEYYKDEGHTIRDTAKVFGVGKTTIENWVALLAETGNLENRPLNRTYKKIDPEKLKTYVAEHNDDTLGEIAEYFGCSIHAVDQALRKHKITYKKKRRSTLSETRRNESNL